jgi:hypothetical protein
MDCVVEDCSNQAARSGLCWTHIKRRQRSQSADRPIREYGRSGTRRLVDAALRVAEMETFGDRDEEFNKAVRWLVKAAQRLRRKKDIVHKSKETTPQG